MAKLEWDLQGQKLYETGVEKCVLYPQAADGTYPEGIAWNGITNITESPSGAESTKVYADNTVYANLTSAEEFGASIEAYMYPDEFKACNGEEEVAAGVVIGQQARKPFGLSYITRIGNDTEGDTHGYKVHLIYNAKATPSERAYATVNDSPEAATMSWELTTTPVSITGKRPTAILTIDSTKTTLEKMTALLEVLQGTTEDIAHLPSPDEIITLMSGSAMG